MSLSRLPSGRWRARCWDASIGKSVPVAPLIGLPAGTTWRTQKEARAARAKAREKLEAFAPNEITVQQWWERWTTDTLFARPKESTNIHNRERTKAFAERYGSLRLRLVNDFVVGEWLAGGTTVSTVPALRAMFSDAATVKAGRLIEMNPFAKLGLQRSTGRKYQQPPSQQQMEQMVLKARELTPPSFAAYFEFACVSGIRPGELDALRWDWVDWEQSDVHVLEQWNAKTRRFTSPKYGPYTIALVSRARQVLREMPRPFGDAPWVFTTNRGTHYTPSSRTHHWNRVRCAANLPDTPLYLATRHYFGWYALNILELEPHIIAEQLGHRDGGKLITQLYGHPDKALARARIRNAFDSAATVTPITAKLRSASSHANSHDGS